jgi:hypothetical protein
MPIFERVHRVCVKAHADGNAEMAMQKDSLLHRSVLCRPGGHSEEPLPDPIPNSAVKVLCADGTKSQGLEE